MSQIDENVKNFENLGNNSVIYDFNPSKIFTFIYGSLCKNTYKSPCYNSSFMYSRYTIMSDIF